MPLLKSEHGKLTADLRHLLGRMTLSLLAVVSLDT